MRRLRAALGAEKESLIATPFSWGRCMRCGWPMTSPSACLGRSAQRHHLASGHNLIVCIEKAHTKAILAVSVIDGPCVKLKHLASGYEQCWVTHGVAYRLEAKRVTGEIISKTEIFPRYGGPLLIALPCGTSSSLSQVSMPSPDSVFVSLQDSTTAMKTNRCYLSRVQTTGYHLFDKKLFPGGTRHDVLDHLKRTVRIRAVNRQPAVPVEEFVFTLRSHPPRLLPIKMLIMIDTDSCEPWKRTALASLLFRP